MMGYTHIAAGLAAAFGLLQPENLKEITAAVIGGAIGGIICDIDLYSAKQVGDGVYSRRIALLLAGAALAIDYFLKGGLWEQLFSGPQTLLNPGAAVFAAACIFGCFSGHRTFTHSILFLLLTGIPLYLVSAELGEAFCIGVVSHLLLDLTNKKKMRLFYPVNKGVSLGLFYADGLVNKIIFAFSMGMTVIDIGVFFL